MPRFASRAFTQSLTRLAPHPGEAAVAQDSASEALSEASSELDALMETWAEDLGLKSTEELEEWIEDFESDEEVSDYSIDGPGTLGDD